MLAVNAARAHAGRHEAETADRRGVRVVAREGASGGRHVSHFDAAGDRLVFTVRPGGALRIRYALAGRRERRCTLGIDGGPPRALVFRPTGGWTRYASAIVQAPVRARVRLTLTEADLTANEGGPCASIDCLDLLAAAPAEVTDLARIRTRLLGRLPAADPVAARRLAARLSDAGTWPDIDFSRWPGTDHLRRARTLAAAGEAFRAAAVRALAAWLARDPDHPNWWVDQVAVPPLVGDVALLAEPGLTAALRARVRRVLYRAWPPPAGGTGRGANLFYRVPGAARLALLERDAGFLASVFARAAAELRVTRGEGIQPDMSFHQHGPQFYAGSYGVVLTREAAEVVRLTHGTAYAFPAAPRRLLTRFILEGQRWIVVGRLFDPAAMGRAVSRTSFARAAMALVAPCRTLAALGDHRAAELTALADRIERGPGPPARSGHRVFWRSDTVVHRRPGMHVSVKMASRRTVGSESGNGEGLANYHLADGTTLVMTTGEGYAALPPVWNWRRLPGTTCAQDPAPFPPMTWGRNLRGTTWFAGGATDGRFGAAGLTLHKRGVRAQKAWFAFDDEVVCLGAGIRGTGPHRVLTTIDQRRRRGPVRIGARAAPITLAGPRWDGRGPAWIQHDGVGYRVAGDARLTLTAASRTGRWRTINRGGPTAPVRQAVFELTIDHGVRPDGASYAHVLVPGATAEEMSRRAASPAVQVLSNNVTCQAVRHDGLGVTAAVFTRAAALAVPGLGEVRVDRACALLLRLADRQLSLAAADPAHRPGTQAALTVHLPAPWGGVRVPLDEGRSATRRLRNKN